MSTVSTNLPMWETTTHDFLGRIQTVEKPAYSGTETTTYTYDSSGRLEKVEAPGLAPRIYGYDELSNLVTNCLDVSGGGIDESSDDRITLTETVYLQDASNLWWTVTTNQTFATSGSSAKTTTLIEKHLMPVSLAAGFAEKSLTIDIHGNETVRTVGVNRSTATVTNTVQYADSTNDEVRISVNGRVVSHETRTGVTYLYEYDDLSRRIGVIDPRTGTSTTHYATNSTATVGVGMIDWVEDADENRTKFQYDMDTGRKTVVEDPNEKTLRYAYNHRGQVTHIWGDTPYPVQYAYDDWGRMTEMHTFRGGTGWNGSSWPASPGTADVTTWMYQESTGLLTGKEDAAGKSTLYTYGAAGRLATRTWARPDGANDLVTAYTYDSTTGELTDIEYSDDTPDIEFAYNRTGKVNTVADSVGTRTFEYNADLQPTAEIVQAGGGGLYSITLERAYEGTGNGAPGRAGGVSLSNLYYEVTYGYDGVGRLDEVVSASAVTITTNVPQYAYLADSHLVESLTESNSEFTISREYEDHRDLLTQIRAEVPDGQGGTNVISRYDYGYDPIGLRTSVVSQGTAFAAAGHNAWDYNDRSELASSYRYLGTNVNDQSSEVLAERRRFMYDPIGNRTAFWDGNPLDPLTYTANSLNQYRYTEDGKDEESFDYDEDGNMTEDGAFNYTWNGENRLVNVEPKSPVSGDIRLSFAYDYMGRRVRKTVEEYNGSSWSATAVTKFVWDGWLLVAELDGLDSDALVRTYTWGLDLSGTFQGAGGIGGLLVVEDLRSPSFAGLYAYDGNGNVCQVIDAEDGSLAAHYEYDPYGREIVATGAYAEDNPWRFSTKYLDTLDSGDPDAALLYYGYRFYSPRLGRWISTDPIGNAGPNNVYLAFDNMPVGYYDALGEQAAATTPITPEQQQAWYEWADLGCGDCPADAVQKVKDTALQNMIDLINWALSGKCYSIKDYTELVKGKLLATATKEGYRSPALRQKPSCVQRAVEWIEEQGILTFTSIGSTWNMALHPWSETPWCCWGNALAGTESMRQNWLYQRLSVVERRCEAIAGLLPPSLSRALE